MGDIENLSSQLMPTIFSTTTSREVATKYYVDDSLASQGRNVVFQTSTTKSVVSSTALQATEMVVPIPATGGWCWDAFFLYSAAAAGDIKFAWTLPPSSGNSMWTLNALPAAGTTTASTAIDITATAMTTALAAGGTGAAIACSPRGHFYAGATGSLSLFMAQNTSSTTASTFNVFSWIRLTKLF